MPRKLANPDSQTTSHYNMGISQHTFKYVGTIVWCNYCLYSLFCCPELQLIVPVFSWFSKLLTSIPILNILVNYLIHEGNISMGLLLDTWLLTSVDPWILISIVLLSSLCTLVDSSQLIWIPNHELIAALLPHISCRDLLVILQSRLC